LTDTSAALTIGANCGTIGTIGDQSVPMFHDVVTHRIHLAMGSIGHPCCTIQDSVRYLSLMRPAVVLLLHWTNNHYPMPGFNEVINL